MRSNGLNPPEPLIPDKKVYRFDADYDDKKKSGWYIGFANATSKGEEYFYFLYGDHRRSDEKFKATSSGVVLDKFDKARLDEEIQKAKRKAHLEKVKLQQIASVTAEEKFNALNESLSPNRYLEKKKLPQLFGARISGFDLVVPMRDIQGNIKNIETVYLDGKMKRGLIGGQRSGLFHQIGAIGDIIYIAEGFSTAATVHMAMNECSIATFNCHNLPEVAKLIATKYPNKKIVICGDDDENDVGRVNAEQAANESGGKFVIAQSENGTDFNDVYIEKGLDEVRRQIESINPSVEVATFDESYVTTIEYPDTNPKSLAKKGTLRNVKELLRRLKITVRYNVISKEEEILIPNHVSSMDNAANSAVAYITDWCERVGIPIGNLNPYLTYLADETQYNPVQTWITSKPWDGKSRLPDLYETIVAKNEKTDSNVRILKERLIKAWLISAVAAAFEPHGVSAHGVLVLQGAQFLGKTMWFKRLVPKNLNILKTGHILKPDDKDTVFQAISNWLVELGELDATFRKSDIAQLKGFLTNDYDVIRRPFAKKESKYARRTVFFGSVNEQDYLKDPTGNRRFWTIGCDSIDYNHHVDIQQLWAEVLTLYQNGTPWILSPEELVTLNTHNEKFEAADPIEDRILAFYDWDNGFNPTWKGATQVCLELGIVNPTKKEKDSAGKILRKLLPKEPDQNREVKGLRQYLVPDRL